LAIWKSANPEYNVNTTNETRTGYPAQDQYNRYFNEIRNLSYWATLPGERIPEPSDQTYFPGYVQHPKVAFAMAGQSSPWPCDINTITVIMQSNVPLIKRCQPVITVTNLRNVAGGGEDGIVAGEIPVKFGKTYKQGHISGSISVLQPINGTFNKTGLRGGSAAAGDQVGSLVIDMTDLLADTSLTQDTVQFSFEVVNRYQTDDGSIGLDKLNVKSPTSFTTDYGWKSDIHAFEDQVLNVQFSLKSNGLPAIARSGRVLERWNLSRLQSHCRARIA